MKRWIPGLLVTILVSQAGLVSAASPAGQVPFLKRPFIPAQAAFEVDQFAYPETKPKKAGTFDIQHYPLYDEVLYWLETWAKQYPGLVELYSAGKSLEGRDIWQITITNKKTGSATDKPAMWVGANRHSGEVTTRVAALHFANELLSKYGKDPEITHLLNTRTFYVRPVENPDGSELYLNTIQTNRSTNRPVDNDGDGVMDEDILEDLDGDGYSRQIRKYVGMGNGDYTKDPADPSGRLMKQVGQGKGDYLVLPEGIDNDGDGKYNEDGIGGLDLHRNYPENWRPMSENTGMGWTQGGAGEYPLSEPEMRSVVLFLLENPHISVVETMDTTVPMHLRPPSTSKSEESMFPEDLAYYQHLDKKGQELTGYPWAGDVYYDYNTRRGGTEGNPLFGHSPDWGYFQYGTIWYGDELWGKQEYVKDYNKDGNVDELDQLWMNDHMPELKGKLFQNWTPVEHPQLGRVEVGGWNPKFWNQNAPAGSMLKTAVEKQSAFNLELAKSLPLLTIKGSEVKKNPDGTSTISVTVSNEGFLPDALKQAWLVKVVRKGTASIKLEDGLTLAGEEAGQTQDAGFFGGALDDGEERTKTFSWTVEGKGKAQVTIRSTRGGTVSVTVPIP
ncbi:M14 family metallopeptidase [Brevibacillus sp. NRS-1366]|uniref:M14 family metallopeptidase n=1 Tax=Brevibacillus sp. NRS-1366 TaxID=3233899 RepID=UPI003D220312